MPSNIFELNCELCKGGHHEDKIILCDQCDRGCHLFCLTPPLEAVPQGRWVCPLCREAEAAGGAFREGQDPRCPSSSRRPRSSATASSARAHRCLLFASGLPAARGMQIGIALLLLLSWVSIQQSTCQHA